jgi:GDP-L-fucose synthase
MRRSGSGADLERQGLGLGRIVRRQPPMKLDSKIYVAGHRGLVGSAIFRKLQERKFSNLITTTSRELDLRRQEDTERFFEKERPDYVFLAAAKVGGILANDTYKAEFIYDNIMIAANVIHSACKYGVSKLLNLGSSCIYPKFAPQPMKEEYLLTGLLEPTNEPYAVAKIAAIKLCRYYDEQYGTNFISVMPTNLFGVGDNFDLETSHVLPALIRKMHLGKCLQNGDLEAVRKDLGKYPLKGSDVMRMKGGDIFKMLSVCGIKTDHPSPITSPGADHALRSVTVELWGSGRHYREFLYVDDVADACVFLMENYDAARFMSDKSKVADNFMNIGTGEDLTIKALANMVKEIVGFEGEIVWDSSKPEGTPRKLLDVSKIKSLGWQPKISLEEGIRKTYEWYRSQSA